MDGAPPERDGARPAEGLWPHMDPEGTLRGVQLQGLVIGFAR